MTSVSCKKVIKKLNIFLFFNVGKFVTLDYLHKILQKDSESLQAKRKFKFKHDFISLFAACFSKIFVCEIDEQLIIMC